MKAFLKNHRQSPRKVRLVAELIKRKGVDQALYSLDTLAKRASLPIKKLLLSAVANAKSAGIEKENLYVKEVQVDKGIVLKRMMPAAMGSAHRINKRCSHITLILGEKGQRNATSAEVKNGNKNKEASKEKKEKKVVAEKKPKAEKKLKAKKNKE